MHISFIYSYLFIYLFLFTFVSSYWHVYISQYLYKCFYICIVAHVALSGQSDVTDVFVKSQPLVKRDRYHVGNLTNI